MTAATELPSVEDTSTRRYSTAYSWFVVLFLMVLLTSSFIDRTILSLMVKPIRHDLNLTDTTFPTEVKFPLYKADCAPDIKFFGFELTIGQARGTEPSPGFSDSLGWFFVIQEVPGEPRFGMDVSYDGLAHPRWEDLSWANFADPDMSFITAGVHPTITVGDDPFRWGKDAAAMAYILFRKPAMVAVHASEMLASLSL